MWRLLILILVCSASVGCKSDEDQVRDVLLNFLESEYKDRTPYRSYLYLANSDKKHIVIDDYAKMTRDRLDGDIGFGVSEIKLAGDRAEANVTLSINGEAQAEQAFVTVREGTKWRVWMGLDQLAKIEGTLKEAETLAANGALEEAKSKLSKVDAEPFRASRPELISSRIETVRKEVIQKDRDSKLDKRITKAKSMPTDLLRAELKKLTKEIKPEETFLQEQLQVLRDELEERSKKEAIKNFLVTNIRVRRLNDDWGITRTLEFVAKNNTKRKLNSLMIHVDLLSDSGDVVKEKQIELIPKGKSLAAGASITYNKPVKQVPATWKKAVDVRVVDLKFAK